MCFFAYASSECFLADSKLRQPEYYVSYVSLLLKMYFKGHRENSSFCVWKKPILNTSRQYLRVGLNNGHTVMVQTAYWFKKRIGLLVKQRIGVLV